MTHMLDKKFHIYYLKLLLPLNIKKKYKQERLGVMRMLDRSDMTLLIK